MKKLSFFCFAIILTFIGAQTASATSGYGGGGGGGSYSYVDTAAVPSSIILAKGSIAPVGGVTNVSIPAAGATDTHGAVTGWVRGTADKIKFNVTDSGGAMSMITINGAAYVNGTDYAILSSANDVSIIVTTVEAGKMTIQRIFMVKVNSTTATTTTATTTLNTTTKTDGDLTVSSLPTTPDTFSGVFVSNLRLGSRGDEVTALQNKLTTEGVYSGPITGYFGSLTQTAVKAYQLKKGLQQDGMVGPATREALNSSVTSTGTTGYTFVSTLRLGSRGDEVTALQNRLTVEGVYSGPITGYFGSLTQTAVKAYQLKKGLAQVGVVGPATREALNAGN